MCTEPGRLDGGDGTLLPLVNFDYLLGVPEDGETAAPWRASPTTTRPSASARTERTGSTCPRSACRATTGPDLGALVARGSNYHVPEVNLAEGNLLTIAQLQTDSFEAEQARIDKLEKKLAR